jgi:hypothetical protein
LERSSLCAAFEENTMLYVGLGMLGFGLLVVIGGLVTRNKLGKILAAPFRRTGELARDPMLAAAPQVSCEGAVRAAQPMYAPCSKQPCVYFEVKVEKYVEETKVTDRGPQRSKTWKKIGEQKQGCPFALDDGSGPIGVDTREALDADLVQSFQGPPPDGQAGGVMTNLLTSMIMSPNERILEYRATEKMIPAQGKLFAMGKLVGGEIRKPDSGALLVSTRGRDAVIGSTKRLATGLLIGGAVLGLAGVPVMFLKGPSDGPLCATTFTDTLPQCPGRLTTDQDVYTWNVAKPGKYEIVVKQPADARVSAWPTIQVEDQAGFPMNLGLPLFGGGSDEASTTVTTHNPGPHKIYVRMAGAKVQGGYRYLMSVRPAAGSGTAVAGAHK